MTHRILACLCLGATAHAGILIVRSDQGLQFSDAVSITVNGKDKLLSLGNKPVVEGQLSKLPSDRIGGILLKDSNTGVLLQYEPGKAEYLAPQNLPKTAPADPAGMWKASKILSKQSNSDKTGTEISMDNFVAFLPTGAEDIPTLAMDRQALQFIGGDTKVVGTQAELVTATIKAYPGTPAANSIQKQVESALRTRYDAIENGTAGPEVLPEALQLVSLSQTAFPASPEQDTLRKQLNTRKAWLERRSAVQKAFLAGGQWDAFLLGDRDLERYAPFFPELAKDRTQAMQASVQLHSRTASLRQSEGDFGAAFREFKLAGQRKPSDTALHDQAMQAWTEYSRRRAMDVQSQRVKLGAGPQSAVERALFFADQNRTAKKLDDALKNVQDAEALLKTALPEGAVTAASLKVWYTKADVLNAQERYSEALNVLDSYDLYAVDEERAPADRLRNQILFSLANSLKTQKGKIQAAFADNNFSQAQQLAAQGLKMSADDSDFLYYSGMSALVHRDSKYARQALSKYLEVSNTLDANAEQRAKVTQALPTLSLSAPPVLQGDLNWLSGQKLPKGVFYDPLSLAFQPHIDRIEASNKLHVAFEWDGEKLKSVTPTFENADKATGEKKISFGYEGIVPQVYSASDGDAVPSVPAGDPDEAYRRAMVILPNNPLVDPVAIKRITGKNDLVVVAPNRFFNPFVWEKLYYFRLTYNDQGQVVHAQELSGPKGAPGEQSLDFDWNGPHLIAIRGLAGKTRNYERTMQYQDGLLVSEEIQGQGKTSKIKYTYQANRLVSAEASTDNTLDNRSRKVTFAANSATTLVK